MNEATRALQVWLSAATLLFLTFYVPLETYVTVSIAGLRGLTYSSYLMNLCGMALMLWGALSTRAGAPHGPAILAVGWSWTTATFWRATADRFWYASLGHTPWMGPAELWAAPILTCVAALALVASLVLVMKSRAA